MPVRLRLARHGAKRRPFYRIVAADQRSPRDGRFLEVVGTYDPNHDPMKLRLNQERIDYWLGNGAQPSDTVSSLLRRAKRHPEQVTFLGAGAVSAAPAEPAVEAETEVTEEA